MTIFQKMLVVPILSVVVYFILLIYSYGVQQDSNEQLEQVRDQYLPMLAKAEENNRLFKEISVIMKDAVIANEVHWLDQTESMNAQILANLQTLRNHDNSSVMPDMDALEDNYRGYFMSAKVLARMLLANQTDSTVTDDLINEVNRSFNESEAAFKALKDQLNERFYQTIDETNRTVKDLLFWGSITSVLLLLMFVVMTIYVSWTTRNSLSRVVVRMKAMAEGDTDFGQRIEHPNKDEVGALVYWFNKLSNKLEQDYNRIETLSRTDKLTQLHNRTHTDEYLLDALAESRREHAPLSLVIFDVDHFKSINDNHGHLVGDAVLKDIAQTTRGLFEEAVFIGRWGGEEFIVVLPGSDTREAATCAEQLRAAIASLNSRVASLSASFGVASLAEGDTVDALIKKADDALYAAKSGGRNQVVVWQAGV